MSIALLTHVSAQPGLNGGTTGAIDTSGANFLVVIISDYSAAALGTLSDSKSNTWTALTTYQDGGVNSRTKIYYSINPTVGSAHTFTYTGSALYPTIMAASFSGVDTTAPFDVENGEASSVPATSSQPGSVTPSQNNELLVFGVCLGASTTNYSDDIGTPIENMNWNGGVANGGAMDYQIQTTATARNPTWSWTTSSPHANSIATFKAAAGGGGAVNNPYFYRHLAGTGG